MLHQRRERRLAAAGLPLPHCGPILPYGRAGVFKSACCLLLNHSIVASHCTTVDECTAGQRQSELEHTVCNNLVFSDLTHQKLGTAQAVNPTDIDCSATRSAAVQPLPLPPAIGKIALRARMCAGWMPQQPPTMVAPAATQLAANRAYASGVIMSSSL